MYSAGGFARAIRTPTGKPVKDAITKARVAGLLHDIGHPSLSHVIEHLFMEMFDEEAAREFLKVAPKPTLHYRSGIATDGLQQHLATKAIREASGDESANPFNNGAVSSFLIVQSPIAELLTKNGLKPGEIARIVSGSHADEYFNQILDGGMDADKFDYLQRDSRATGVRYGTFDSQHILRNIRYDGTKLYVDEKAAQACIHFLLLRYFWYSQIVLNKNLCVLEEMAKRVYCALAANHLAPTPRQLLDIMAGIANNEPDAMQAWLSFNDDAFFRGIDDLTRRIRAGEKIDEGAMALPDLKDFLQRLRNGHPLPRVVRIDAVEYGKIGVGKRLLWSNMHPRYPAYERFIDWISEHKASDLEASRIIVLSHRVPLLKDIEEERPVYVKNEHDPDPMAIQDHYCSVILPMSEETRIRFSINRVYCVDSLETELKTKWDALKDGAH
jgi:hypothetical protein